MKIAEYKQIGTHIEVQKKWVEPTYGVDAEGKQTDMITEGYWIEEEVEVPTMGMVYREATEEEIAEMNKPLPKEVEIEQIRTELASYDYIGVKLAMGVATREEYADKIAHTEVLRARLRELEE